MKLGDLFGKKDVSTILQKSVPYKMTTSCFPYKLYANRKGSTMLTVSIENLTSEPLMSSIVIKLPSKLSFDQTGLSREKEIRLGEYRNLFSLIKREFADGIDPIEQSIR